MKDRKKRAVPKRDYEFKFTAPRIKTVSEYRFPGLSHLEIPVTIFPKLDRTPHEKNIGFSNFPVLEPVIHTIEHELPHAKPSAQTRVGLSVYAKVFEDSLRKAGCFVTFPTDPLKFINDRNLKFTQKFLHGTEILYATTEGFHLAHHYNVNPWEAGGLAFSTAAAASYAGIGLGNTFLTQLAHEKNILKRFGQICVKSNIIGSATVTLLDMPLNYYSLAEKYDPMISSIASALGTAAGAGASWMGLVLVGTGIAVPSPASILQIPSGLAMIRCSSDISKDVAAISAKGMKYCVDQYHATKDRANNTAKKRRSVEFFSPALEFKTFKPKNSVILELKHLDTCHSTGALSNPEPIFKSFRPYPTLFSENSISKWPVTSFEEEPRFKAFKVQNK